MILQCKIFDGHQALVIERQINTWLESQDSHIERVKIINTNQSTAGSGTLMYTQITIFYERVKK
jgi:hypothetical protein